MVPVPTHAARPEEGSGGCGTHARRDRGARSSASIRLMLPCRETGGQYAKRRGNGQWLVGVCGVQVGSMECELELDQRYSGKARPYRRGPGKKRF